MPGEYNGRIPVTPLPGGRRTCPFCVELDLGGRHDRSCPLAVKGASAENIRRGDSARSCKETLAGQPSKAIRGKHPTVHPARRRETTVMQFTDQEELR
jgi:hypothetical protein